jgi:hypothetical protein
VVERSSGVGVVEAVMNDVPDDDMMSGSERRMARRAATPPPREWPHD